MRRRLAYLSPFNSLYMPLLIPKTLLEKDNMFEEDNIGAFWGILETRPYMRAKHNKLLCLLNLKVKLMKKRIVII